MKHINLFVLASLMLATIACSQKPKEIIACGDDQVIIIDKEASEGENVKIIWSWKVSEAVDLPEAYQKLMIPTDECKPDETNSKILITSSGGGVVLVDRKTKKSLFYAHAPMAHSAEFLPGNKVVIALSTHQKGNSIEVYDLAKPEQVVFRDSLYSGHGVVWMKKTQSLYALGYDELRRYTLKNWETEKPLLQLEEKWTLPDNGGHDLSSISDTKLALSTSKNTWLFNIEDGKFGSFEPLDKINNVKSINYNESSRELVYTKGEISWWTHNIYCKNPDKVLTIPGINIYKVRVNL